MFYSCAVLCRAVRQRQLKRRPEVLKQEQQQPNAKLESVDVDIDPEIDDTDVEIDKVVGFGVKVSDFNFEFDQDLEYDQLRHQPRSVSRLNSLNPMDAQIYYGTKVEEMTSGAQFRRLRAISRNRGADQGHEALW